MAQQINLCTAAFKPATQKFGARTMLRALAFAVVAIGVLSVMWVWNLKQSSASYVQTNQTQTAEIASLKAAITQSRANAGPVDPALLAQLQERRNAVKQREVVLDVVERGMFRAGEGHSDRMRMVSRSIPAEAWITELKMDANRFEVTGFTIDPAALNDWVRKLSADPLMRNLKLSAVKVENKSAAKGAVWSFNLTSLEPAGPIIAGAKP
jgi:Tfp pilus assembly protein PilN